MTTTTTMTLAPLCLAFLLLLQAQPSVSQFPGGGSGDAFWNGFWNHNSNYNGNFWHQWNTYQPQRPQNNCPQQFTDCMYKGDLALRLTAVINNGQVLSNNADLILNYDLNRDNCITGMEFITVTTSRGFSVEYARNQFNTKIQSGVGVNNAVCPGGISTAALRIVPQPTTVDAATVTNNNVQSLATFCDQNTLRYQQNCDCIQLPAVCNKPPFQITAACGALRTRYASYVNICPFSYGSIIAAKAICASGNLGTNAQLAPVIRLLCNSLNQKAPTVG